VARERFDMITCDVVEMINFITNLKNETECDRRMTTCDLVNAFPFHFYASIIGK
jgi:hypothetical protein